MTPNNKDDQFDDGLDQYDEAPNEEFGAEDFAAEGGEDDSFAEEDWDSYDDKAPENGDDGQDLAPAKKKSSNFNKIVIGVAVLVGAGIFVMQFGGNAPPAPPQNTTAAPTETPVPAPLPVEANNANNQDAPAAGGFLGNADGLAALEQDIAKSYENSEVVVSGTDLPEVDNAVTPPMPTAITPDVVPVAPAFPNTAAVEATPSGTEAPIRMPKAEEMLLKQPSAPAPAAEPAPALTADNNGLSASSSVPVTEDAAVTADVSAELVQKMDQILSRLGQLESDVNTLKSADQTAVSAQIEALQQNIKALEEKAAAAPAPKVVPKTVEKVNEAESIATQPKPQILGSPSSANDSPVVNAPKAVKKAPVQWVLKGAQPGRAMVSQPGESDMRSVAIGDTLPGIGRITAISYENGRWQVLGTQGAIHQ